MTRRYKPAIELDALATMTDAADRAIPKETGGILLGFRSDQGLHITGAIEVTDLRATKHAYRRAHRRASKLLAAALADQPSDSPVGYVGEWHTHPAPAGPSDIDMHAIAATALAATDQIALVVLARCDDEWQPIVAVAEPQPPQSPTRRTSRRSLRRPGATEGSDDALAR